jgi:hypothetical protein
MDSRTPVLSRLVETLMSIRNLFSAALVLTALAVAPLSSAQQMADLSSDPPAVTTTQKPQPPDFNNDIYYEHKVEGSFEAGYLPVNIPFVFDFLTGSKYELAPLRYTLVPTLASIRWHGGNLKGPSILRGNWDLSGSFCFTFIPKGAETRYIAYVMGIRRNFVHRNWRIAPFAEGRLGLGSINAKEPYGVRWAQGEDFTFNVMLGSGFRYNFSPRFSIEAGALYQHISNLYLSEPEYPNYGINVYGPMFGLNFLLYKPKGRGE